MVRKTGWSLSLLAAAALLFGCARGKAPEIKEDWLARVPPSQMKPVEQAREELRAAQNDKNRADVALQDAENRLHVAKAERDAARSRVEAAENQVKLARNTGDAKRVQQAQAQLSQAEAGLAAADAQVEWAEANREAARARVKYAEEEVDVHEALLRQAEYQVLADANDTRVENMDPQTFEAEVAQQKAEAAQARQELEQREQQVATAYEKWDEARTKAGSQSQPPPGEFPRG